MKTRRALRLIVSLLLWLLCPTAVLAELQLLHSFDYGPLYPQSQLVQASDGNFYGTAPYGGDSDYAGGSGGGCVFRATPAGNLTNFISFWGTNGANPLGGLCIGPSDVLYGTTQYGGSNNLGVVFSVTTSGVFNLVYQFDGTHGSLPKTGLTLGTDGNLYGTTSSGGANNYGTIFRISTGGALTTLYSFGNTNAYPGSSLCQAPDGNFYGTTQLGPANGSGAYANGTIYRITTSGVFTQLVGLTNTQGVVGTTYSTPWLTVWTNGVMYGTLYSGTAGGFGGIYSLTTNGVFTDIAVFSNAVNGIYPTAGLTLGPDNSFYGTDLGGTQGGILFKFNPNFPIIVGLNNFNVTANGSNPIGGLTLGSDGKFYGVTENGGDTGWGELFNATTIGVITGLASFNNTGGISPRPSLTLGPDGNFYGVTYAGGPNDDGTIFRIATNGAFTVLATMNGSTNGYEPIAPLCVGPDGALYGLDYYGGIAGTGSGTIFSITTNGVFKVLYAFQGGNSGAWPQGGLALGPDNQLYGTTYAGGTNGSGTIFRYNTNGTFTSLFSFNGTNGNHPEGTLYWHTNGVCYGTTYAGGTNSGGSIFCFNLPGGTMAFTNFVTLTNFGLAYNPVAGLVAGPDGNLYGTSYGNGYLYRINPAMTGLVTAVNNGLHISGSVEYAGYTPGPDGYLYTVTYNGGAFSDGSLIRMDTNGNVAVLSTFSPALGVRPYYAPPVFGPDGNLYGTTSAAGPGGGGTIYRFVFDRITNVQRSGNNAIISATGTTGGSYAIYASTNFGTGLWTNIATLAATNAMVQYTDTNAWRYAQRYYRTAAQ